MAGGSISPAAGTYSVPFNGSFGVTATPDVGKIINRILLDGEPQAIVNPYTLTPVTTNHELKYEFASPATSSLFTTYNGASASANDITTDANNESAIFTRKAYRNSVLQLKLLSESGSFTVAAYVPDSTNVTSSLVWQNEYLFGLMLIGSSNYESIRGTPYGPPSSNAAWGSSGTLATGIIYRFEVNSAGTIRFYRNGTLTVTSPVGLVPTTGLRFMFGTVSAGVQTMQCLQSGSWS